MYCRRDLFRSSVNDFCLLLSTLLCQRRAWSTKFSLPLSYALHCNKEMPNKSQRKHSGPSGLSLCLITEALHRWTTASTGKTPTILKLDSWVCYQVRGKTNRGAFIFFMQKFCKLLICNVTFYSKCLNFFPKWSHWLYLLLSVTVLRKHTTVYVGEHGS